jgi:50S ribosomal subunit-associated GTPase HflX
VVIKLPEPKLLSLQMDNYHILRDEDGFWNKLDATERESAVSDLQKNARLKVLASPLLAEAKTELEKRIQEIVSKDGYSVEFEYTTPTVIHSGD